MTYENALNRYR